MPFGSKNTYWLADQNGITDDEILFIIKRGGTDIVVEDWSQLSEQELKDMAEQYREAQAKRLRAPIFVANTSKAWILSYMNWMTGYINRGNNRLKRTVIGIPTANEYRRWTERVRAIICHRHINTQYTN